MNNKTVLSSLLLIGAGVVCAAPAAKKTTATKNNTPAADVLKSDKERDSFAIAEQLYRQGNVEGLEETARRNILGRVSELLKKFADEFPESANRTKALYMCATCEEKLGRKDAVQAVLKQLAASEKKGVKDEYVAAAAYKLGIAAFSNGLNNVAADDALTRAAAYFGTVERCSKNAQLVYDSLYRHARALTVEGQRKNGKAADEAFAAAVRLYDTHFKADNAAIPAHIQGAAHYAYAQLLVELGADEHLETALAQFKLFLAGKNENENQRSIAILQSARIATKLGKTDEAAKYYEDLTKLSNMKDYAGEANMEIILALYRADRLDDIRKKFPNDADKADFLKEIRTPALRAQCAGILGHVYMQDKKYAKAAGYFLFAESEMLRTPVGADAGYRLIVCLQQLHNARSEDGDKATGLPDLLAYGRTYLSMYDTPDNPETQALQCTDIARVIYADHVMKVTKELPWEHYLAVDMNKLPEYILEDTAYKKAWCLFRAWSENHSADRSPEAALNFYIDKLKNQRRLPDVLCMRGNFLYESKFYEDAINDFVKVIEQYKDSPAYAACLQRAAHACLNCQPPRNDAAKKYFSALLAYAKEIEESGQKDAESQNISVYAAAEANFNLGRLCYQNEPEKSVQYFKTAKELNGKDYAASASACLIQCYFKLKNTEKKTLLEELPKLKKNYNAQYKSLSKAIPRWCGWCWYQEAENNLENYKLSVEYINDSIDRNKTEIYTAADGTEKERPVAESVVWLTLARACLEIEQYRSTESIIGGLDAIDYYLSMEKDPHRRADGLKTKAMLLNGCGEPAKATELCTEALNLGVNGPVLSSIRLVAGDSAYLAGDYEKASQLYGLVANFDRNNDLNREALYKAACALRKNGKEAEAANYEERLEAKLKEMKIDSSTPLRGLPPSVSRHVSPGK